MAEDYGKKLYEALPPLYRREDAKVRPKPYPLKRFLQVTGTGFNFLAKKQEGHSDMFNLYKTPSEFLPHLGEMLGYNFPYEMTEIEQRNFLKVLPYLYKFKGTEKVFDYLGIVVYGSKTKVRAEYRNNTDPANNYHHAIDIYLEISGSLSDIIERANRYNKFANNFRPMNTVINPIVQLFYDDVFTRLTNTDIIGETTMFNTTTDVYDRNIQRDLERISLLNFATDSYNRDNLAESREVINITVRPQHDSYDVIPTDTNEDYALSWGGVLGLGRLGDNFKLGVANTRVKL